jgi:hypothetical protein
MHQIQLENLELDYCSHCKLIWFDRHELCDYQHLIDQHAEHTNSIKIAWKGWLNPMLWTLIFGVLSFIGRYFVHQQPFIYAALPTATFWITMLIYDRLPNILIFGWPVLFVRTDKVDMLWARTIYKYVQWLLFAFIAIMVMIPPAWMNS